MKLTSLPIRALRKLKRLFAAAPVGYVKSGYVRDDVAKADAAGVPLYELLERDVPANLINFRDDAVRALLPYLPERACVVEIGTGAGFFAARLLKARPGLDYLSFEPEKGLARHLDKWLSRGGENFRSLPSSGIDLKGVEPGTADAVIAYGVFTVLDAAPIFKYLGEARRVLKPGGVLMFDIFDTDQVDRDLIALVDTQVGRLQSRPYLSSAFLTAYLREHGFSPRAPVPSAHRRYALMHLFQRD
jgi:SAM-dependent methyltransferase